MASKLQRESQPYAKVSKATRSKRAEGLVEGCRSVPYLEPQARQHENGHRAEVCAASLPDTDLKDGRFDSIPLGEEGQWVPSAWWIKSSPQAGTRQFFAVYCII
jgi:hypothetical protein